MICNFFKDALIKRTEALITELLWGSKKIKVKFQYESVRPIIEPTLKEKKKKREKKGQFNIKIEVKKGLQFKQNK